MGCQSAAQIAEAAVAIRATSHERDFHTEGERWGGALPPAGLVLRCAPNGAASHQTF
jgi:hypothetical protein